MLGEESMGLEVEALSSYIPLILLAYFSRVHVPDLVNEHELCD